eukprot:126964-Rhodomonas_salina.3
MALPGGIRVDRARGARRVGVALQQAGGPSCAVWMSPEVGLKRAGDGRGGKRSDTRVSFEMPWRRSG